MLSTATWLQPEYKPGWCAVFYQPCTVTDCSVTFVDLAHQACCCSDQWNCCEALQAVHSFLLCVKPVAVHAGVPQIEPSVAAIIGVTETVLSPAEIFDEAGPSGDADGVCLCVLSRTVCCYFM